MQVSPDFLAPLLEGFDDECVFAVSCQIFFRDPAKRREETGLTEGWWQDGGLKVRHRVDPAITGLFPCFYGGGGSCAFDRRKFLELGGFDELLAPFYLEDTDLGYLAWKRGWKVLYQPRSIVLPRASRHHRQALQRGANPGGAQEELPAVLLEEYPRLAAAGGALLLQLCRRAAQPGPATCPAAPTWMAGGAHSASFRAPSRSRWRARGLAVVDDTEAFRRPLGGYFRDRFEARPAGRIAPPARAVRFALSHLPARAWRRRVHVSDAAGTGPACDSARGSHARRRLAGARAGRVAQLLRICRVRGASAAPGHASVPCGRTPSPSSQTTIWTWLIHRQTLSASDRRGAARIHAARPIRARLSPHSHRPVRARYLFPIHRARPRVHARNARPRQGALRVSAGAALRVAHAAALRPGAGLHAGKRRLPGRLSAAQERALAWMQAGLRAGIDTARYRFLARRTRSRSPCCFWAASGITPNAVALDWFVDEVLPRIVARPAGGAAGGGGIGCAAAASLRGSRAGHRNPRIRGRYPRAAQPLCGVCVPRPRRLGRAGEAAGSLRQRHSGGLDPDWRGGPGPRRMASSVCSRTTRRLSRSRCCGFSTTRRSPPEMAARARAEVVANWDMATITGRLVESYWDALREKNPTWFSGSGPV